MHVRHSKVLWGSFSSDIGTPEDMNISCLCRRPCQQGSAVAAFGASHITKREREGREIGLSMDMDRLGMGFPG